MTDQRNGGITWAEQTWNPLRGCTRVSAGRLLDGALHDGYPLGVKV